MKDRATISPQKNHRRESLLFNSPISGLRVAYSEKKTAQSGAQCAPIGNVFTFYCVSFSQTQHGAGTNTIPARNIPDVYFILFIQPGDGLYQNSASDHSDVYRDNSIWISHPRAPMKFRSMHRGVVHRNIKSAC